MLTPEKRDAIQARWKNISMDLMARDGHDPEYPGQSIKGDPELQKTIFRIFQNYICFFIEEGLANKNFPETERQTMLSPGHADWVKHRYTSIALKALNRHTHDAEANIGILGSIIRRAIEVFNGVFPELPQAAVLNESAVNRKKYWVPPPDEISR